MAGRLTLRSLTDSNEKLGISRGYISNTLLAAVLDAANLHASNIVSLLSYGYFSLHSSNTLFYYAQKYRKCLKFLYGLGIGFPQDTIKTI